MNITDYTSIKSLLLKFKEKSDELYAKASSLSTYATQSWVTQKIPTTLPANGGTADFLAINRGTLKSATYGSFGGILQDATDGPRSGIWSNRIKILHSSSAGYYTELAQEFDGTENHLYFRELNNGRLSAWKTVWDSSNLTKVSQLTNDAGYVIKNSMASTVGDSNGYVSYYCNFPAFSTLQSEGYLTSSETTHTEPYLKALCKWIIDTYGYKRGIYCGIVTPNSTGYCHIQVYADSGQNGYPKYCSGVYYALNAQMIEFGFDNNVWRYDTQRVYSADKLRNSNGGVMTFNWSGVDGQPTWLWGGNDGSNMYVYNPKNFSVDAATRINSGVSNDFKGTFSLYYTAGQFSATAGNGTTYKTTYYPTGSTSVTSKGEANIMNLRLDWDSSCKYWHDIFASPNSNTLWHRSVIGAVSSPWYKIVQEDGGTYNITSNSTNLLAGYSPNRYVPVVGYYGSNSTPGYLILTDIPVNTNTMFVAHIWGNSHDNYSLPLDLYIQGYIYSAKVYSSSVGMLNNGCWIERSYIFSYNGNVGIWLPFKGSYVSIYADIRIASGLSTTTLNHCISITGSSKPTTGISDEISIPMHSSIYYNERTGSTSLDSLKYNGFYYISESASNYPTNTENGHLLNLALKDTKTQLVIPYMSSGSIWYRGGSTSLGNWKKVLDSSNYSSYALPLSGGTMQGPIKFNSASLPEKTTNIRYITTIDSFADGGTLKWVDTSNIGLSAFTNDLNVPITKFIKRKSDYHKIVILLCKVSEIGVNHYCIGHYYSIESGTNRFCDVDISFYHYRWSSSGEEIHASILNRSTNICSLVKCTYNGETWYAINEEGNMAKYFYFVGNSVNISNTYIAYYSSDTKEVLNSEIYGSIQYVNDSNIATTKLNNNKIYHEGNANITTGTWKSGNFEAYTENGLLIRTSNPTTHKSVILRNDGGDFYFLTSPANSTSYDTLRPFSFNLSTGLVKMWNGLSVTGTINASNGLICNDSVYFRANTTTAEIIITKSNETLIGSNSGNMYVNYRKASLGTTVTNYIWNAGSSSTYASHTLGALNVKSNLTVAGTSTLTGDLTVSGKITSSTGIVSNGYIAAKTASSSSDIALKKDIVDLENALGYILNTHYVKFRWRDNNEESIGIIAQEELGREYGFLVQKHSEYLSYNYAATTALLGAALQEEDNKVEKLKKRIEELENELNTIKESWLH